MIEQITLVVLYLFSRSGKLYSVVVGAIESGKIHEYLIPAAFISQQFVAVIAAIGYASSAPVLRWKKAVIYFIIQFVVIGLILYSSYDELYTPLIGDRFQFLVWLYYIPSFAFAIAGMIDVVKIGIKWIKSRISVR